MIHRRQHIQRFFYYFYLAFSMFYLDIKLQTGFKQRKARAPFGEPPPPEFPPFRRPLQLRVYPPVGLPDAREGSPRLRAFSPRIQEIGLDGGGQPRLHA